MLKGNLFASPSVNSILSAIRYCAGKFGVLLIVKNYTGDRLNFGMAMERALAEGILVDMVIVDDDCATWGGKGITGGRGVAGTVFVHKLSGAMAEQGKSLNEVKRTAEDAITRIRSIGFGLSTCTLFGQIPTNRITSDAIEVGIGIHGESGIQHKVDASCHLAEFTSNLAFDMLHLGKNTNANGVDYNNERKMSYHKGDSIILLVNNLGGCSELEMAIITNSIMSKLTSEGFNVCRIMVGTFLSSLDCAGVSISVMDVASGTEESGSIANNILSLYDQPTNASNWKAVIVNATTNGNSADLQQNNINTVMDGTLTVEGGLNVTDASVLHGDENNALLNQYVHVKILTAICEYFSNIIIANEISALDAVCGDGDCGSILLKGCQHVLLQLRTTAATSPEVFNDIPLLDRKSVV